VTPAPVPAAGSPPPAAGATATPAADAGAEHDAAAAAKDDAAKAANEEGARLAQGPSEERLLGLAKDAIARVEASLQSKTVQDVLEGWQRQLEGHRALFARQAEAVDRWDARVHEARLRLERASADLRALRGTTTSLRSKLQEVRSGQAALESKLHDVEQRVEERRRGRPDRVTSAARERREFYGRAVRVDAQLSDLQAQVRALVDRLRGRGGSSSDGAQASAEAKIRDILDAHASDLEWVDAEAAALERRAMTVEARLHRARP